MIHADGGSVYGPYNPHPLSTMHIGLIWGAYHDEYGNRRLGERV